MAVSLSPTVFSRCIQVDALSRITAACCRTGTLPQFQTRGLYVQHQFPRGQICNLPREDQSCRGWERVGGRLAYINQHIIMFLGPARGQWHKMICLRALPWSCHLLPYPDTNAAKPVQRMQHYASQRSNWTWDKVPLR